MSESIKPITPNEVAQQKIANIPSAVIDTFNKLIALNYTDGSATVKQADVIHELERRDFARQEVLDKGWLNVEEIYRDAGWAVVYNKPAYSENYDAYFTFKKKR